MITPLRLCTLSSLIAGMLTFSACKQQDDESAYSQKVPERVTKQIDERKAVENPATPAAKPAPSPIAKPVRVELGDGLAYEITQYGEGREVKEGDSPVLNTILMNTQGGKLWADMFEFQVGSGKAVQGFDKGVRGMKLGEKRTIYVPWSLAYGAEGMPPRIQPKQDLIFHVQLDSFK